jgi:hypothetical protein
VPGAVTVVVVPTSQATAASDKPPQVSDDLLRAVARALDLKRLITTEVVVTAADYVPVRVTAQLDVAPEDSFGMVKDLVTQAVKDFFRLAPATPGAVQPPPRRPAQATRGRAGAQAKPVPVQPPQRGWSFGNKLYPSALYEVILAVQDEQGKRLVRAVTSLRVQVNDLPSLTSEQSHTFAPNQLPYCIVAISPASPEGEVASCP